MHLNSVQKYLHEVKRCSLHSLESTGHADSGRCQILFGRYHKVLELLCTDEGHKQTLGSQKHPSEAEMENMFLAVIPRGNKNESFSCPIAIFSPC